MQFNDEQITFYKIGNLFIYPTDTEDFQDIIAPLIDDISPHIAKYPIIKFDCDVTDDTILCDLSTEPARKYNPVYFKDTVSKLPKSYQVENIFDLNFDPKKPENLTVILALLDSLYNKPIRTISSDNNKYVKFINSNYKLNHEMTLLIEIQNNLLDGVSTFKDNDYLLTAEYELGLLQHINIVETTGNTQVSTEYQYDDEERQILENIVEIQNNKIIYSEQNKSSYSGSKITIEHNSYDYIKKKHSHDIITRSI